MKQVVNAVELSSTSNKIHIAHIVYSFATGGLENGVVNLINQLPEAEFQHSIICITDHDTEFVTRINTTNVQIFDLHKPAGKGLGWLYRCWRLLRQLQPDICHTRNLNPLEAQLVAWLAGIKVRIHGEHGWDVNDLNGGNKKNQLIKKLFKPFIQQYIALSKQSLAYLSEQIGVPANRLNHICNGVDIEKFHPQVEAADFGFANQQADTVTFGTVGRAVAVKNQQHLLKAFIKLKQSDAPGAKQAKLVIVGDGVLRNELAALAAQFEFAEDICLAGQRADIPQAMAAMDVFILPSLAEGISNTILEAMATGLPVIATNVGGNPDLILPQHQASHLIDVDDVTGLCQVMIDYIGDKQRLATDSALVRQHCEKYFSIDAMVTNYHRIYTSLYRQHVLKGM